MRPVLAASSHSLTSLTVPFRAESARIVRETLGSWLLGHGVTAEMVEDARLVVTELIGNSVRHARPLGDGGLEVTWGRSKVWFLLAVCDGGGPTVPRLREPGAEDLGGRGLAIVDALASRWSVEQDAARTHVWVRMRLVT